MERSVNELLQVAAAARLRRFEESSTRAEAGIKSCHAATEGVRASVDAAGLQLSSHIHDVSSALNDMGQRVGALARQEATIAKAYERITQETAEIRRVTAPLEQVTTLQRVVNLLEPKVGTLEGHYQTLKIRQTTVIEQLYRTASLLDERTITIKARTSRLNYCEQTLQTALNRITILEKGTGASTESPPPEPPNDPPPSHSCSGSDVRCPWCASKVSSLEDANQALEHEVARLNTQVVDLRGRVLHQSEDKASWKAEVPSEMRESLEAIRRQHLEEIRDCHHRLILAESGSDRLQTEVMNPLARRVHEVDRQYASLKRQVQHNAQELALVKGRQQVPGPPVQLPDVSTSLNFDVAAVEARVAEHNTSLRALETQLPEVVNGMETLANAMEVLEGKLQEWEDECADDGEDGRDTTTPCQSVNPDPSLSHPTYPVKAEPGAPPHVSTGEGARFSHCPYGDTTPAPGVGQFSGLGDILRPHTNPSTPKPPANAPTLLHEAGGATLDLPGLDMKGTTHDGEKHVSFSNVQEFFKSDPLSPMGDLPSLRGAGKSPVLGTPDLGSCSVPDGSVPGSAPTHKDPKFQVRALFGTDKLELETLDPETRQLIKDLLSRAVFRGDWATFEPEWDRYRGFWCKGMAPDLLAYVFCSCFPDEGNLYASLVRDAGWTYDQIYGVASTIGQGRVSGELLEKQWIAMDLPRPKTVANYSLWIIQWVLHARRTARKWAITPQRAKQVWRRALEFHGGYGAELAELAKLEALHGEFTWEAAHSQVVYELTWRDKRKWQQKRHDEAQPATPAQARSASAPAAFKGACHNCGEKGHRAANCPKPKKADDNRDRTPGHTTGKGRGKGSSKGKGRRGDSSRGSGSWGDRKPRQGDDKAAAQGLTPSQQKQVDWALRHATRMAKDDKCMWCGGDHHPAQCQYHVKKNVARARQAQVDAKDGKPAEAAPQGDAKGKTDGDTAAQPAAANAPTRGRSRNPRQ